MGLMQTAWRTYEQHAEKAGVLHEGKEALLPISHIIQKAQIDIIIDDAGAFQGARALGKGEDKTIIPATIESASRTSGAAAHPLSDNLEYLAPYGGKKYEEYLAKLTLWAESEFSHPKVHAVLRYIQGGTLLADLAAAGIIELREDGTPAAEFNKSMVRWQVIEAQGGCMACYEDQSLFACFSAFYASQHQTQEQSLCLVTGEDDIACDAHPKGVHPYSYGAKLISANDNSGFTYRGRFATVRQAGGVGYTASQKAHAALRWIAVNHGVVMGGRSFLCWNPDGHPVPEMLFGMPSEKGGADFVDYKRSLLLTLGGYKKDLKDTDDIVVAAMDAATTGRLSVTYYNEFKAHDFLQRIEHWYTTCCWNSRFNGVTSPLLKDIVTYAFGTQRERFVETDDRVLREHVQRLLYCVIEQRPIPTDIVRALTVKAGNLQIYTPTSRENLLVTACAVIRKHRNDLKEEWDLALDTSNTNRSYLFGRLLAVAEQVERTTYDYGENRETNAIRMQSVFAQRPLYGWRIIDEKLGPYFTRLYPAVRSRYKDLIGEITGKLPGPDDPELGKALSDTYLLGYYHQRTALLPKIKTETEETGNESTED